MKIASTFLELLAVSARVPCADEPEKFFGDNHDEDEKYSTEDALEAAKICRTCPVRFPCLSDAFASSEQYGVRGGLTPVQRESARARI